MLRVDRRWMQMQQLEEVGDVDAIMHGAVTLPMPPPVQIIG